MITLLASLLMFSVILGVHCYCDLEECREELKTAINNTNFCNSVSLQKEAVLAVRKCVFYEDKRKEACPVEVRRNTPIIANLLQNKLEVCGLQTGRASCNGPEYFVCLGGLAGFAFITNIFSLPDISSACTQVTSYLTTLDVCKSCIGNFFGQAWTNVQDDVEKVWGIATSLLSGACDCAGKIQTEVDRIDRNSTCRFVQSVSKLAEGIAQDCVVDLVESVQTFDWLTITNSYIKVVTSFTNNACFFIGGAATAVLGLSTVIMVLISHFVIHAGSHR